MSFWSAAARAPRRYLDAVSGFDLALISRSVGDEVEFSAPSGDRYFEIAAIEFK